jgi:peptide/nickel transport system permease protein
MKGYTKYFLKKLMWFVITLVCAVILNFTLPRLMPQDPVAIITSRLSANITEVNAIRAVYQHFAEEFGTDKPIVEQFFIYVGNIFQGEFGRSFAEYPREVTDIISKALPWTLALQFPAIIVGWLLGNILGALAAYVRKFFDKGALPFFLFLGGVPAFGMAIILLSVFGIGLHWFPTGGAYGTTLLPTFSWQFISSVLHHYWLPFLSIVLISIGGQALGMRSMGIYELNADYVKYSRYMGIKDGKIVRYVFRNAMLPQVTGLALSIGTMVGGALVAETIFSYPGLGTTLMGAVGQSDYPVLSACTLIITVMVLIAAFLLDIIYGLIDPRVKAALID